ncbi:MAG: NlpC/P60 family protein [Actinomycetota bacterium]|jgi:peptidoglycan DL-endopeptidase CwlO
MSRKFISFLIISILFSTTQFENRVALAKNHKPTLKQIKSAKKIELEKKKVAEIAAAKLDSARGNLKKLAVLANVAQLKYSAAQKELFIATAEVNVALTAHKAALVGVSDTHNEIGNLARTAYMAGGGLSDLESVLNSDGPQEVIDRISALENLGARNKTVLFRYQEVEVIAQKAKMVSERAQKKQQVVLEKVLATKKEAEDVRNAQQAEVAKLQAVQDKLQRELASARKVRLSLEQRRQLAILEESRSIEAGKVKNQSKVWEIGGPTGAKNIRTNGEERLKAVEFAKRQVLAKKPYVWGDEGPNSFDCSGLVYAAYKYIGLGWPNWDRLNASLYYTYTMQIPIAEMQPGDLIFYSYKGTQSTIHHMSIYAGGGMMWEARSTATGLRYSDIYSVPGMMPFAGRV